MTKFILLFRIKCGYLQTRNVPYVIIFTAFLVLRFLLWELSHPNTFKIKKDSLAYLLMQVQKSAESISQTIIPSGKVGSQSSTPAGKVLYIANIIACNFMAKNR